MLKILSTAALKAKAKYWNFEAKAIKCGLKAPEGQGLASVATSYQSFQNVP